MGLKNMYDFRELYFKKIMRNVICCLKVHRYLIKFFRLKIIFIIINSKMEALKTSRCFMFFKFYGSLKTKSTFPLSKCSQRFQQYRASEKICLELKDLMSQFLDIRSSCPNMSCNSLKNVRDAVFNLTKFHAKGQ